MIKAENIKKSYEGREVLRGISLSAERGEFVSIMGKSGSGKSTLLGILAGNIVPDSGEVFIDGALLRPEDDKTLSKLRRTKLGFVYQSLNLIPTLSAEDNILLPLYLDRKSIREGRKKLPELCELLGIEAQLKSFPSEMSGGERQRVAIARAMIHDPMLLMLDEPTGSLDSGSTYSVMKLLRKIVDEKKVTVLQVTHSPEAAEFGDRTIRLSDGEVVSS